jgi:hypothetical protein
MTRFRLSSGLTIRELPDGDAVVAAAAGSDAVIVNASAHALLELLGEPRSEQELARFVSEAFPEQDPAAIARDVGELVQQLVRAGLVEPCGTAPSTA